MTVFETWGVTLMVADEMPSLFEWVQGLPLTSFMAEDFADWSLVVLTAEQADHAAQLLGVPEDEAPVGFIRTGKPDPEVQAMFQTDIDTLMAAWEEVMGEELGEVHELISAHREQMGEANGEGGTALAWGAMFHDEEGGQ